MTEYADKVLEAEEHEKEGKFADSKVIVLQP